MQRGKIDVLQHIHCSLYTGVHNFQLLCHLNISNSLRAHFKQCIIEIGTSKLSFSSGYQYSLHFLLKYVHGQQKSFSSWVKIVLYLKSLTSFPVLSLGILVVTLLPLCLTLILASSCSHLSGRRLIQSIVNSSRNGDSPGALYFIFLIILLLTCPKRRIYSSKQIFFSTPFLFALCVWSKLFLIIKIFNVI